MKILYFLAHPYGIGGASRQMIYHSSIMRDRGHDVLLVIQGNEEGRYDQEYDRLCSLFSLDYTFLTFSTSTCIENIDILESEKVLPSIKGVVEDFHPDIIHSLQLNTSVEMVARMMGIPHLFSIYQICPGMFSINWADVFAPVQIGDSEYYCNQWKAGLDIDSYCIRVVYDADNTLPYVQKKRKTRGIDDGDAIEIISVAHFYQHKRQLEILRFIKKCKESGLRVHISFLGYDKGAYAEECKNYVYRNHMKDMVSFCGYIDDASEHFGKADLFLHASTSESYPGVIVEAMASGVPVISTPAGGIPELVSDGINGFLTEDYSYEAIYDKFLTAYSRILDGSINCIIDNAYETYLNNHTRSIVGDHLEKVYCSIRCDYSDHKSSIIIDKLAEDIKAFYLERSICNYSEYTRNHSWFLYHIKCVEKRCTSVYIWGTGAFANIGIEWCEILGFHIEGFFDSNNKGLFLGYNVFEPTKERIEMAECILVSVAKLDFVEEIMRVLESNGKNRNIDYFLVCNDPCLTVCKQTGNGSLIC